MPLSDKKTRLAVIKYAEELPAILKDRYGGSGFSGYTAMQIRTAIEAESLPESHASYAVALFGAEGECKLFGVDCEKRDKFMHQVQQALIDKDRRVLGGILAKLVDFLERCGNIADGAGPADFG